MIACFVRKRPVDKAGLNDSNNSPRRRLARRIGFKDCPLKAGKNIVVHIPRPNSLMQTFARHHCHMQIVNGKSKYMPQSSIKLRGFRPPVNEPCLLRPGRINMLILLYATSKMWINVIDKITIPKLRSSSSMQSTSVCFRSYA